MRFMENANVLKRKQFLVKYRSFISFCRCLVLLLFDVQAYFLCRISIIFESDVLTFICHGDFLWLMIK